VASFGFFTRRAVTPRLPSHPHHSVRLNDHYKLILE
jgi:hypothetical protein